MIVVSIDLPERLVDVLETRARERNSSLQEVAIEAIENEFSESKARLFADGGLSYR